MITDDYAEALQGMKRATKVSSLKVSQAKKVKVGRLKTVLRKVTIKK